MAPKHKSCSEKVQEIQENEEETVDDVALDQLVHKITKESSQLVNDNSKEKKKMVVGVVWSERDEIALLNAMVDYPLEKGINDPSKDMSGFFEYVKGVVSFDMKRKQLTDKLCRLRQKFFRNGFVLSKPHDRKLFEIAKKIQGWRGGESSGNDGTKRRKGNVVVDGDVEEKDENVDGVVKGCFYDMYPWLCHAWEEEMCNLSFSEVEDVKDHVEKIVRLIGEDNAKEMEEKWTDLHMEEWLLYAKKIKLTRKQFNLVMDAIQSHLS